MHETVGKVFLLLMLVIAAAILYFLFFGTVSNVTSETYEISGGWKGVIGVASENIETSIARYYYNYCYLPTIQSNDKTDELLGYTSRTPTYSSEAEVSGVFTTSSSGTYSSCIHGCNGSKVNYD